VPGFPLGIKKTHPLGHPETRLSIRSKLVLVIALAFVARVLIDIVLKHRGYLYGEDPDTFWRLGLSWQWAQKPFLKFGIWPPLQFWIVGLTFRLLQPFGLTATPLVPVIWNHLFLAGSLATLYALVRKRSGELAAVTALILATAMAADIRVTYSGLVEPLLVLAAIAITLAVDNCIDQKGPPPTRSALLMSLAAFTAAAAHYQGWYLAAFVLAFLLYSAYRAHRSGTRRFGDFIPTIICSIVAISVPVGWLCLNHLMYGDPLRFLSDAQSYHWWFAHQESLVRLTSSAKALWATEPGMVLAAGISLPLVAHVNRRVLLSLLPALAYFVLLSVSGLMSYGVPEMHPRYSLVVVWLLVPVIAAAFATLARSRSPLVIVAACAALCVLAADGIIRAFHFRNWMDPSAQRVAANVDARMADAAEPLHVLIEQQPCLFPTAGIANSLSRPDWTRLVDSDKIYSLDRVVGSPMQSFDLGILTSPLTVSRLSASSHIVAQVDEYTIVVPGQPASLERTPLPEPWAPIREDEFLSVNQDGTIHFAFSSPPSGPMDAVGIHASLTATPGRCYVLSADVQDWQERASPTWAVLQQLIVNDVVLWSHDVAGSGGCWQRLDHYVVAMGNHLDVKLVAVAPSGPLSSLDWPSFSLTGIRNLHIGECQ
jgi:hypothetical protein